MGLPQLVTVLERRHAEAGGSNEQLLRRECVGCRLNPWSGARHGPAHVPLRLQIPAASNPPEVHATMSNKMILAECTTGHPLHLTAACPCRWRQRIQPARHSTAHQTTCMATTTKVNLHLINRTHWRLHMRLRGPDSHKHWFHGIATCWVIRYGRLNATWVLVRSRMGGPATTL